MKKIPAFAIEGAAFAGKTTLLEYLKKAYSEEIIIIPESSEYVGGDYNFPDVPFKTYKDAKASTYFFIELEKRRCREAIMLHEKTGLPVLMDRTTPVSSLIFYSLLKHIDPSNAEFIGRFYHHALEAFQAQIDTGNLFIPNKIIYLKPKNQKIFEQRFSRGTKNSVFASWDSFRYLDKKYNQLIHSHLGKDHKITLLTENSRQNLEEIAEQTMAFMREHRNNTRYLPKIFQNFLNQGYKFKLNINVEEEELEFLKSMSRSRTLMDKANIIN